MPPDAARVRILDDWRAGQAERRADRSAFADRALWLWGAAILVAMLLYMLIGPTPYQHEAALDPDTGANTVSPINRVIWLALFAAAAPILWFRRAVLMESLLRLWPLILLFCWFSATTRWALDPNVSNKRLFLYLIATAICLSVSLGVREGRRMHQALAVAAALMVAIDLGSWVIAPAKSMTELGLAGIHTHKNTLGSAMMLCGLVCGSYLLTQRTFMGRLFWGAVLAAAFVLLVASKSKTSLAIFLVASAAAPVLALILRQRASLIWALTASVLAGLGALALGWFGWCFAEGRDPFSPLRDVTFTQRRDVWVFVIGILSQHPWTGVGFGSMWDVDAAVQPSLQTDFWFAKPDAFTNEAHNGYLDLAVTTGVFGLLGSLALLMRWIWRSLGMLRLAQVSPEPKDRQALPYSLYLGLFPLLFFVHNFMESSYFTANATFGTLILLIGTDVDLRWPDRSRPGGLNAPDFGSGR